MTLFPEDIWKHIKTFLLVELNGIVWEKITLLQDKYQIQDDIRLHLFYRVLGTDRTTLCYKIMDCMFMAYENLKSIESHITRFQVENEPEWNIEESVDAYKYITLLRICNQFMEIYETDNMKKIFELVNKIDTGDIFYDIGEYINQHYCFLDNERLNTEMGKIDYIWKIDEEEIGDIQKFCINPITVVEKEEGLFAIAFSDHRRSYWKNCFAQTIDYKTSSYINPLSHSIGSFANKSRKLEEKFKHFLDIVGFPIVKIYSYDIEYSLFY
jgi:hypothetical protein